MWIIQPEDTLHLQKLFQHFDFIMREMRQWLFFCLPNMVDGLSLWKKTKKKRKLLFDSCYFYLKIPFSCYLTMSIKDERFFLFPAITYWGMMCRKKVKIQQERRKWKWCAGLYVSLCKKTPNIWEFLIWSSGVFIAVAI